MNSTPVTSTLQPATPPGYIMGVENTSQNLDGDTWHVDYFRVTLWPELGIDAVMIVETVLNGFLGAWVEEEKGRYGYNRSIKSGVGAMIYYGGTDDLRYTIEFPGQACQVIGYERLAKIYQSIARNSRHFSVTRLDVAFDEVPFTPYQFMSVVTQPDKVRSYFKRDKIAYYDRPFEKDEANNIGTSGVSIGGRSSTRYLRCYDKHGFTRLEIEYKKERADLVACDLFLEGEETAIVVAMGHLLDYIDIDAAWWIEFKQDYQRLYKKLETTASIIEAKKIAAWLIKQASGALAVLHELGYEGITDIMITTGREKMGRSSRYAHLVRVPGSRSRLLS